MYKRLQSIVLTKIQGGSILKFIKEKKQKG